MIKALRIEDFQSIGKLDVECGPITVIHGESDTGKSAVVRALYALAFNSYPKGHVRDGADKSVVEVELDEVSITATKGNGANGYRLESEDGSELVWEKVGADVPAEVMQALGWREIELDDGSRFTPNFHRQFDPPFLLTDSPSKRAKVLGSLTNAATLFAAIKEANSWERRVKITASTHREIAVQRRSEADEIAGSVELLQVTYEKLQGVIAKARVKAQEANRLTALMLQALKASEAHQGATAIIEMMDRSDPENLDRIEELIPRLQGMTAQLANIEVVQARLENVTQISAEAEAEYEAAKLELDTFIDENEFCPVCGSDWHE